MIPFEQFEPLAQSGMGSSLPVCCSNTVKHPVPDSETSCRDTLGVIRYGVIMEFVIWLTGLHDFAAQFHSIAYNINWWCHCFVALNLVTKTCKPFTLPAFHKKEGIADTKEPCSMDDGLKNLVPNTPYASESIERVSNADVMMPAISSFTWTPVGLSERYMMWKGLQTMESPPIIKKRNSLQSATAFILHRPASDQLLQTNPFKLSCFW